MILDLSTEQAYLCSGETRVEVNASELRVWVAYLGIQLRQVDRVTEQLLIENEKVFEWVFATWFIG